MTTIEIGQESPPNEQLHSSLLEPPRCFPTHPSPPASEDDEAIPQTKSLSPAKKSRKQVSVAKLPIFDFNPGMAAETKAAVSTPPESPIASVPTTPRTGLHRRTDSEYLGGDVLASGKPQIPLQEAQNSRRGHKHRRSGAVSQDVTTLPSIPGIVRKSEITVGLEPNDCPGREAHHVFSIPVGEAPIPQPFKFFDDAKKEGEGKTLFSKRLLLPVRPATSPNSTTIAHFDNLDGVPDSHGVAQMREGTALDEEYLDGDSNTNLLNADDLELSGNFEEDPSASVISTAPQSPSLASAGPSSPALGTHDQTEPVIDLDEAFDTTEVPDTKTVKGKTFITARRSMHSGQPSGGFFAPGMQSHRRTESAPQLAPVTFSRPEFQRLGTTASDKGFTMEDVFEEDEEEVRSKRNSMTRIPTKDQPFDALGIGINVVNVDEKSDEHHHCDEEDAGSTPTEQDCTGLKSPSESRDSPCQETPRASRHQTPAQGFSHFNDMITVVDSETASSEGQPSHSPSLEALKPRDSHGLLHPLRTSPMNSDFFSESTLSTPVDGDRETKTSSTFSTPRLDTGASSLSSRKVSLPNSNLGSEDGNASTRSRHTRPGSTLRYLPRRRSPMSSRATADRQSGSASSFVSHGEDKSSKRNSIASLSQLLGRPFADTRRSSSVADQGSRCQTSDGLAGATTEGHSRAKPHKKKRLSRLFKFWKESETGGWGAA